MRDDGFNPMRWNCETQGCFNKKCRPKIQVFADCFPRKINFGDVDGILEIGGRALALEWKRWPCELEDGPRRMWEAISGERAVTLLCAAGDAETMEVTHQAAIRKGEWCDWQPSTMAELKNCMRGWSDWTERNSLLRRR